ncbi:hypothetical protein [Paenibacillus sp. RC67]|uniref:hypothetical protein n=1 Tax=Paenibacillus sp. RC67 TaxID=3039392 RepID=UPI0024AE6F76|nr:hypothetical protein [Paenibacillus sp. RC67]
MRAVIGMECSPPRAPVAKEGRSLSIAMEKAAGRSSMGQGSKARSSACSISPTWRSATWRSRTTPRRKATAAGWR